MDTEMAHAAQMIQLVQKRGLKEHNEILQSEIRQFKSLAKQLMNRVGDYEQRKYTGEYALFVQDDAGKWSCIDIVNPDDEKWVEEEFPAFTLIMPIPEPETMPEWDGF